MSSERKILVFDENSNVNKIVCNYNLSKERHHIHPTFRSYVYGKMPRGMYLSLKFNKANNPALIGVDSYRSSVSIGTRYTDEQF